jgi:hypothetical protein
MTPRRSKVFGIVTSFILAMMIVTLTPLGRGNFTVSRAAETIEVEDGEEVLLREQYFQSRTVDQRQIDAARTYAKASLPQGNSLPAVKLKPGQKAPNYPYPITNQWQQIGPNPQNNAFAGTPQAGRVSSVAVDQTTSGANQVIYIGSANGGVWKTVNNGATWTPMSDNESSLAIGAVTIDPNNNQIIYAGTGESFKPCADCYRGSGVLKSTNGGSTWTLYGTAAFGGSRTSGIARIRVNKNNSNDVWAASTAGLAHSTDGGVTWALMNGVGGLPAGSGTIVTDEVVLDDSVNPAVLYTVYRSNGVYKSTDGGATWTKLTNGLPGTGVYANRTRMAIAPSNNQVLYSVTVNASGASYSGTYNESYYTTDAGATWTKLTAMNANFSGSQGWYDLDIAVDPLNDNTVYFAGIDVFVSTNARGTAATGAYRNISNVYTTPNAGGIHPDQHSLAFAACAAAPCRLYVGNDGGMFYTNDGTVLPGSSVVYTNLNTVGLAITEFTGGDIGPNFATGPLAIGGTQDNGTMKYTTSSQWDGIRGGDGGFAKINWQDPQRMYHTYYSQTGTVSLERSNDGGATWVSAANGIDSSSGTLFYTNYTIDRSNPNHMLLGTNKVHESFDGGLNWEVDSAALTTGSASNRYISTVAVAPSNNSLMWAGTNDSKIFKATNGATAYAQSNWTDVSPAGIAANVWHNEFWIDPKDPNTVYVVGGRFTRANGIGTAYKTTNGGTSWTSIMGDLPNLPVNSIIAYDSVLGRVLVVGNDIGVFYSLNDGTNWTWANNGFPNTAVSQVVIDPANTTILAFTHGRSVWKTTLPQGNAPTNTPGPSPTNTPNPTGIPSQTATATPTYFYCNAALNASSPTYLRADSLSTLAAAGNYYYRALSFTVSTTGAYNLFMTNAVLTGGSDGFYNLYQNSFDSSNALTNIIAYDDDSNGSFGSPYQPRITGVNLTAGTTYILVGTAYDPLQLGTFTDNIQGAGTVNATCPPITPPSATPTATSTSTPKPPVADTIGVYNPATGMWYLRNSNTNGPADITVAFGGDPSDLPVVGDWNNDRVDTIGVYRSSTGFFFLSNSNTSPAVNYTILFGNPGDTPLAGHWDNLTIGDSVGVYRNSNGVLYERRSLTSGFDDYFMIFGNPGDVGVAGDWNGDGYDSTGVYRTSVQTWYLNDFSGNGIAYSQYNFNWDIGNTATNKAFVGDWNADGISTAGFYNNSTVTFTLHSTNNTIGSDTTILFGPVGSLPVAGRWVASSAPPPQSIGIRAGGGANPVEDGRAD